MVASEGTIVVDTTDGHMRTYLEQLERLDGLGLKRALPAHGAPIDDPSALFRHYIAHRLGREAKVRSALETVGRPASLADLVPHAYADAPKAIWPLAQLALEAHLVKLEEDGVAIRDARGWRLVRSGPGL
jgi:glyoxylase-like metal-dependent hydrolase (beta-lactamase superfamily II)